MTATIPIPVWALLLGLALVVAWQAIAAYQTKLLRDLFRLHWKQTYGEESP